jgi:hypothetical protein
MSSDWYPNKSYVFFDRRKGQWKGINPHDNVPNNANAKNRTQKGYSA